MFIKPVQRYLPVVDLQTHKSYEKDPLAFASEQEPGESCHSIGHLYCHLNIHVQLFCDNFGSKWKCSLSLSLSPVIYINICSHAWHSCSQT